MTDILTLSLTHGRRSFSVLHDAPRVPPVYVQINDGEYRPGMVNEIAALAELMPKASLEELLEQWRGQARPVPSPSLAKLPINEIAASAFWPTLSVTDCADACRIIFDLLTRNPQDDLDAVVVALNEKGFGEVAGEMRARVNTTDIG